MTSLTDGKTFMLGVCAGILLVTIPVKVFYMVHSKSGRCGGRSMLNYTSMLSPTSGGNDTLSDNVVLSEGEKAIREISSKFRISTAQLHSIIKHFRQELNRGLSEHGQALKALPSFVTRLPSGLETGSYLALDLGGTNLRVCEVVLEGQGKYKMRQQKFVLSDEIKVSDEDTLFGFIADCTKGFLESNFIEYNNTEKPLLLGFTFSFPVDQTSLDTGLLMNWNKGFEIKNTLNKDVVSLLRKAFDSRKLNIKIVAIVNDTVGTLVAHCYKDSDTKAGVILGTGTNCAYVETLDKIPKWDSVYMKKDPAPVVTYKDNEARSMIINIEWGNFDNDGIVLPISKYDKLLDQASENQGFQTLEKMISGLYMGEIVRYILVDLASKGYLFNSANIQVSKFVQPHTFQTLFMSRIERDHSQDLSDTKSVLEDLMDLGVDSTSDYDRRLVKRVCEVVGIRSARLSAACVGAVILQMNKLGGCTIAIDGSVFEFYPHFKNRMLDALREIFGIAADNINLELARDGSGVGAALIAAVMGKQE